MRPGWPARACQDPQSQRSARRSSAAAPPQAACWWRLATAELGIPATLIAGSAPLALVAAVKALVALELNGAARDVEPDRWPVSRRSAIAIPWQTASVGGESARRACSTPPACRRMEAKARFLWPRRDRVRRSPGRRRALDAEALIDGSPPDALRVSRAGGGDGRCDERLTASGGGLAYWRRQRPGLGRSGPGDGRCAGRADGWCARLLSADSRSPICPS